MRGERSIIESEGDGGRLLRVLQTTGRNLSFGVFLIPVTREASKGF